MRWSPSVVTPQVRFHQVAAWRQAFPTQTHGAAGAAKPAPAAPLDIRQTRRRGANRRMDKRLPTPPPSSAKARAQNTLPPARRTRSAPGSPPDRSGADKSYLARSGQCQRPQLGHPTPSGASRVSRRQSGRPHAYAAPALQNAGGVTRAGSPAAPEPKRASVQVAGVGWSPYVDDASSLNTPFLVRFLSVNHSRVAPLVPSATKPAGSL